MCWKAMYWKILHEADVVVSTAKHEFFGVSVWVSIFLSKQNALLSYTWCTSPCRMEAVCAGFSLLVLTGWSIQSCILVGFLLASIWYHIDYYLTLVYFLSRHAVSVTKMALTDHQVESMVTQDGWWSPGSTAPKAQDAPTFPPVNAKPCGPYGPVQRPEHRHCASR